MYKVWSETNAQSYITLLWIILKSPLLRDFYRPSPIDWDVLFVAVHLPPKGVSKLVFSDSSDDPILARLEAVLGNASQFWLHSGTEKNVRWGYTWPIGQVANGCLYALPPLQGLDWGSRVDWAIIPVQKETSYWMTFWTFFGLKIARDLASAFLVHCFNGFSAGLAKPWRQNRQWHWWSFLSL